MEADKLKQRAAKPKEKIVYIPDPKQEEEIEELNQKIADLNQALQVKTQALAAKDQHLKRVYNDIDDWIKEVFW